MIRFPKADIFIQSQEYDEINVNKTSGIDNIRCDILKLALKNLLPALTWLLQLSFKTGVFPDVWKVARVNPIPKTGNERLVTNWRPISLLSLPSKIAEKLMHMHLSEVLEKLEFLADEQFGYRSGRGTGDAIFRFVDDLYDGIDRGHLTPACFLDLKKAFDSVSHEYLLEIVHGLGLHQSVTKWLTSYLTGRQQFVRIGSFTSGTKPVNYEVPQGSVLGPLLFILYVNDVTSVIKSSKFLMYADDLVFYTSSNKASLAHERLQSDIDNVFSWCTNKRLTVNTDKTKLVWFGSVKKLAGQNLLPFHMNGRILDCMTEYTYLGLRLDYHLSMELAVKDVIQKVNNRLFRFAKLRYLLTLHAALLVYKTMVMTLFDYCSFVYSGCNDTSLPKLQRLQNRGLRICYRSNREYMEESVLHTKSGLPLLSRRRDEVLLTWMYKFSTIDEFIDTHRGDRITRSNEKIKFKVKRAKLQGYKKSPWYRGNELWNNLGLWFQTSNSKFQFKMRVKKIVDLHVKNDEPLENWIDEDSLVFDHRDLSDLDG